MAREITNTRCCLFQTDLKTGIAQPIAFFSRKFNQDQTRHFSSLELEIVNIIDSLARLRSFISQSSHKIRLVTDAKAVLFLLKALKEGPNPKLSRMASRLAEYELEYEIHYEKPTPCNSPFLIADFLSRCRGCNDELNSPPMKSFRKIGKEDIKHDLNHGSVLSLQYLIEQTNSNPDWFSKFPTPSNPFPSDDNCEDDIEENSPLSILKTEDVSPSKLHYILFQRESLSPGNLILKQMEDDKLRPIIDELRSRTTDQSSNENGFYLLNDVLHKIKDMHKKITPENSLLAIPRELIPGLISHYHVNFGHIGYQKTIDILNSLYYAPRMATFCKQLTSACHLCQLMKSGNARLPPISPKPQSSFPLHGLGLDFCSVPPFRGFKFVLIAVDLFSGFVFTKPCKTEAAHEVTTLLSKIFAVHGPPIFLKSDNGTGLLRSSAVKTFLSKWGVENISLSLAYAPIHNPKVERCVKSLRALFRAVSPGKPTGWMEHLDLITLIHNSVPRNFKEGDESLLISPFELFLNRKPVPIYPTPQLIKDPSAKIYFQKTQEEIVKTQKFVTKFLTEQNRLHVQKSPPPQGKLANKHFNPYLNGIYVVT